MVCTYLKAPPFNSLNSLSLSLFLPSAFGAGSPLLSRGRSLCCCVNGEGLPSLPHVRRWFEFFPLLPPLSEGLYLDDFYRANGAPALCGLDLAWVVLFRGINVGNLGVFGLSLFCSSSLLAHVLRTNRFPPLFPFTGCLPISVTLKI